MVSSLETVSTDWANQPVVAFKRIVLRSGIVSLESILTIVSLRPAIQGCAKPNISQSRPAGFQKGAAKSAC